MGDGDKTAAEIQAWTTAEMDRVGRIRRDYGDTDFANRLIGDRDFQAHYAPEEWKGVTDDKDLRTSNYSWNAARAQWNDLSDADKQIAVDDRKMALANYEKRQKEAQALSQVSRIMDQREAASKAAGTNSPGRRPLTGGYGSVEPMATVGGAKLRLGE